MLDFIEKLKRGEAIMQASTAGPQTSGYAAPAAAPRVYNYDWYHIPQSHLCCCLPLVLPLSCINHLTVEDVKLVRSHQCQL